MGGGGGGEAREIGHTKMYVLLTCNIDIRVSKIKYLKTFAYAFKNTCIRKVANNKTTIKGK